MPSTMAKLGLALHAAQRPESKVILDHIETFRSTIKIKR